MRKPLCGQRDDDCHDRLFNKYRFFQKENPSLDRSVEIRLIITGSRRHKKEKEHVTSGTFISRDSVDPQRPDTNLREVGVGFFRVRH